MWRDRPGELSFVPPDGRFVLAGYECNLMPDIFSSTTSSGKISSPNLHLPASVEMRTSLGPYGEEFEATLTLNSRNIASTTPSFTSASSQNRGIGSGSRFGNSSPALGTNNGAPSSTAPALENVVVTIPISGAVRNVNELRASRGDATYLASEGIIEWRIPAKDSASIGSAGATLRCGLVGPPETSDTDEGSVAMGLSAKTDTFDYDENATAPYQSNGVDKVAKSSAQGETAAEARDVRRVQQNAALMPRSASLSFGVKGWLASGIKVESLTMNPKTSKGLGAGVTPYKGVKYHTVSRRGIEVRC